MCEIVGCGSAGLPDDLESAPVDAGYAATLAAIDRDRLCGGDQLRLAQARNRVIAWSQAQLFADLYAVSRSEPIPQRLTVGARQESRYRWAECEVAYALRWTTTAAGTRLEQARSLCEDLPQVWHALATGEIDLPKAQVIIEAVSVLTDPATAREVADRVLAHADQWTTGQLRARLRRLVIAADNQAAARRTARAVRDRRVETAAHPDGSGEITGLGLPPQDTAAAWERLTAIAKATKNTGDTRTMDQLRADALLDLLLGEGVAAGAPLTEHTVPAPAAAAPEPAAAEAAAPERAAPAAKRANSCDLGSGDSAADWDPAWPREPSEPLGPHDVWPDPTGEPPTWFDRPHRDFDGPDLWPADWPGGWLHDPAVTAASRPHPPPTPGSAPPTPRPASPAPQRAFPPSQPCALPAPRRGVIELQVSLETLAGLAELPGELTGFGPVAADIARQITARHATATWRYSVYDRLGELIYHGTTHTRPAPRHPTNRVAEFVRARDRTCVAPGCRRPPRTADLDHTIAHADGGPTEIANLGVLCRRHHRFKHTPGTELYQLTSGTFAWRTPLGRSYITRQPGPVTALR